MNTPSVCFLVILVSLATARPILSETLKVNGSTTVNLPIAECAEILRSRDKLEIQVDTQGGSSGGISSLGDGLIQIGMSSKPLSDTDRKKYPKVQFHQIQIGEDAVALVVSSDVYRGGVRAMSKDQVQKIYEGKIKNWTEVGGPKARIAFFNKEPGRGTWEVFAHWLYGDAKKAPQVSLPEVGGNEETRNKVASTRGAISQLSSTWADGKSIHALAIVNDKGEAVEATPANIANKRYPMTRPLFLLTNGEPTGNAKKLIDFVLSKEGQEIVRKHGYLSLDQLGK